ncbi:hypothetical protein GE09DRAFT_608891 [Coniochaeta sp. 2T2.1]|nr:hypothetical protein GE09DRAFT_608891 [Coniochaeta sp. 2T2.1]
MSHSLLHSLMPAVLASSMVRYAQSRKYFMNFSLSLIRRAVSSRTATSQGRQVAAISAQAATLANHMPAAFFFETNKSNAVAVKKSCDHHVPFPARIITQTNTSPKASMAFTAIRRSRSPRLMSFTKNSDPERRYPSCDTIDIAGISNQDVTGGKY